ncbi:ArsR/SmtB family transcription factor [Geodermatophilus pulveris]|nr:metalloregulator ArsR/SmtB family transcription factor [Geodermatophilus pulveris]
MRQDLDVRLLDPGAFVPAADRARLLAPQLKALSDPNRLHLLLLLADGPRSVRELADLSGMGQTLVSHHLAPLREQGLVTVTPRGRSNVHALCCEALAGPVRLLATLAALTPEGADACCTPADAPAAT